MTRSPTAGETAAGERKRQGAEAAPAPKLRVVEAAGGVLSLDIDPDDSDDQAAGWALLRASLGGHSRQLTGMLVTQLAELSRQDGDIAEVALNNNLSIVRGIRPRDTAELLLAMQMAAVHGATMATARRLNGDIVPARQDSPVNALSKLARTFAMQMESLKRYRNGVPQPDPTPAGPDDRGQMTIIRTIIRDVPREDRDKVSEAKLGDRDLGEARERPEAAAVQYRRPRPEDLADRAGDGQMDPRVKPADDDGGEATAVRQNIGTSGRAADRPPDLYATPPPVIPGLDPGTMGGCHQT